MPKMRDSASKSHKRKRAGRNWAADVIFLRHFHYDIDRADFPCHYRPDAAMATRADRLVPRFNLDEIAMRDNPWGRPLARFLTNFLSPAAQTAIAGVTGNPHICQGTRDIIIRHIIADDRAAQAEQRRLRRVGTNLTFRPAY